MKRDVFFIYIVFFFVAFSPGIWMPTLPNVLNEMGFEEWIPWIYIGMPIGSLFSPFLMGTLADGKIGAHKLAGIVMLVGGVLMTAAFIVLHYFRSIEAFVAIMFLNSLCAAPIWSLTGQVALAHLRGREEKYAYLRLLGTVGWLVAGLFSGYVLSADTSAFAGIIGGLIRFPIAICCFFMPACEPLAKKGRFSFLQMIGEGSKELWTNRNTAVLLVSALLVAIPLSAHYMYIPRYLKFISIEKPTIWMAVGQWAEIPAMLLVGWLSQRFRMKWILFCGLFAASSRYLLLVFSEQTGLFFPVVIALVTHGITFAFFYTMAQVYMEKRVEPELRGRAQGMLSLCFGGIGTGVGTLLMGAFYKEMIIIPTEADWTLFWVTISGFALVPTVLFGLLYKRVQD